MRVINSSFEILDDVDQKRIYESIERAGRVCYRSEGRMGDGTAPAFIRNKIMRGHESIIEHEKITVRVVCDRGVTHELVRHRIASYSQESTRYCNYSKDKFGNELTFIKPCFFEEGTPEYALWKASCEASERCYLEMLSIGVTPEKARTVLPNSLRTEIIVTMNIREWRHFFKLRTSEAAHPQMREIALPMLEMFYKLLPDLFYDIVEE